MRDNDFARAFALYVARLAEPEPPQPRPVMESPTTPPPPRPEWADEFEQRVPPEGPETWFGLVRPVHARNL